MRGRFFQNLKASTLQILLNQGCGAIVFYILAMALTKQEFGQFNWSLAFLLIVFGILGFGFDQVIVKKIAAGENAGKLVNLFITHSLITGVLFYLGLLLFVVYTNPVFSPAIVLLPGLGKLFLFFSSPLKQLPAGKEVFQKQLYMSVVASVFKASALSLLALFKMVGLQTALLIYMISDMLEFVACMYFAGKHFRFQLDLSGSIKNYKTLLKDMWPQIGSVVLTAAMARLDWLLIGILLSSTHLAEYSFAYRVFEFALLPLWIIGPLLLPYFARRIASGKKPAGLKATMLFRSEMIIATCIALLLATLWVPIIQPLTSGRYGVINQVTIQLLAASMPLIYINNFLWSILFGQNQLKLLFGIVVVTLLVNVSVDLILIPMFGNVGAATGFLAATLVQTAMFVYHTRKIIDSSLWNIMLIPATAFLPFILFETTTLSNWGIIAIGMISLMLSIIYLGFLKTNQFRFYKIIVSR